MTKEANSHVTFHASMLIVTYHSIRSPRFSRRVVRSSRSVDGMSSKELLAHLQNGAKLHTRWRWGKRMHELTLSSGTMINIQYSAIKGLFKANAIHGIDFGGGSMDYYLEGQNWYDVRSTP